MEIPENYQKRLFPYAYNILGNTADAQDIIQDVITKFLSLKRENIENELGYLIKMVVNNAINLKVKQLKTVGSSIWLPEPITTEYADDGINREDILSYSLLVMLEYLNPKERAVFILKEAYEYSHQDIAETLSISVENSRKLLSRSKITLKNNHKKNISSSQETVRFLQNYMEVIKRGDISALENLLTEDVSVRTDGGSTVKIVSEYTSGIEEVAALMLMVYNKYQKDLRVSVTVVNHQPAILFYDENKLVNCQIFEMDNKSQLSQVNQSTNNGTSTEHNATKIKNIYSVVDPSKLK